MSIDKLKRVMWRLREGQDKGPGYYHQLKDIRLAIINEIGSDQRTIDKYISLLKEAGMLKRMDRWNFRDEGVII